jgi:hypothetical protein
MINGAVFHQFGPAYPEEVLNQHSREKVACTSRGTVAPAWFGSAKRIAEPVGAVMPRWTPLSA